MDVLELPRPSEPQSGTPPPSPLEMPAQDFSLHPEHLSVERRSAWRWQTMTARLFVLLGTLAGGTYGVWEISMVVEAGGTTMLEYGLFVLFALTFTWIVFAACTAIAGFVAGLFSDRNRFPRISGPDDGEGRTAILVPVYNENPDDVCARIVAMAEDFLKTGARHSFEFFILSDTRDPDIWVSEEIALNELRTAIGPHFPVWYRRRHDNSGRKAGNVDDFVTRWGGRYEFMVVLDADSLMTARAINALVADIEADPDTALVQTAPKLVNASTVFARSQQFANQVYGPVFARGLAGWQGSNGNFWGHNAIIRIRAFAQAAGLPVLKNKPPFGGTILSHDFVEAALLCRNSWKVRMRPDIVGSYEEMPPTLSDVSSRDRRWLQGNLQHMRLIGAKGFTAISRLHLLIGVMSYLTSPLWFLLILVGLALSVQAHFIRPEYFTDAAALFPMWPRFDTERMLSLLFVTLCVLFTPKVLGFVDTLLRTRRASAWPGLFLGFIVETLFAALVAPIMMLIHTRHFASILSGRDGGWKIQARCAGSSSLGTAVRQHLGHTMIGFALAISAFTISIDIFLWMMPILAGLVFAIPISVLADRPLSERARSIIFPDQVKASDPTGHILNKRYQHALAEWDKVDGQSKSGLYRVLTDKPAHGAHDKFLVEKQHVRGHPDPFAATAAAKIDDAGSLEELMSWLCRDEEIAILSDRRLIGRARQLTEIQTDKSPRLVDEIVAVRTI